MNTLKLYKIFLTLLMLLGLGASSVFAKDTTVDFNFLDNVMNNLAIKVDEYPPKFVNEDERQKTVGALQALIEVLDKAAEQHSDDKQILFRDAYANALGHNLDFPNAALKARTQYEKLLKLDPNSAALNYQYGTFLSQTYVYYKESIPFLQKAAELGAQRANVNLAMVYLAQQDQPSALKSLKKYAQFDPNNQMVNGLIDNIEHHQLKINVVTESTPKQ